MPSPNIACSDSLLLLLLLLLLLFHWFRGCVTAVDSYREHEMRVPFAAKELAGKSSLCLFDVTSLGTLLGHLLAMGTNEGLQPSANQTS